MKRAVTTKAILLFSVLFFTWWVLSGHEELLFLAYGALSSAFAVWIAMRMNLADHEGHPLHLAPHAPLYWAWLAKEMVVSGWRVTQLVWGKSSAIQPCMAWVPLTQDCDLGRAIYANSITLTPGTVSVEVEPERILVHALEPSSIQDLRQGGMDRRVTALVSAPSSAKTKD